MSDLYYVPPSLRLEFSEIEMVELMEQFKEFDTSGDGAVDANELKTMMESMNVSINMEELEELIAIVDTNGSGQIEFHEFVRMMSNLRRGKSNKLGKFMQLSKQAFQIRREFQALVAKPIPGCRIEPVKQDMRRWNVYMEGPTETPYAGGSFHFDIQFGHEYPYEPPDVCLRTQIYHINFILLLDGTAAIPWLAEIWTPDWRARELIERLMDLLRAPDPDLMRSIYRDTLLSVGTTARTFGMACLAKFKEDRSAYDAMATQVTQRLR